MCKCNNPEHTLVFFKDDQYPEVYLHLFPRHTNLLQRLLFAVKYAFGITTFGNEVIEFVLTSEHYEDLKDMIGHLENENIEILSYH